MDKGTLFWVIMIVAIIFFGWGQWAPADNRFRNGWGAVVFILLALLGWAVFGNAIK